MCTTIYLCALSFLTQYNNSLIIIIIVHILNYESDNYYYYYEKSEEKLNRRGHINHNIIDNNLKQKKVTCAFDGQSWTWLWFIYFYF